MSRQGTAAKIQVGGVSTGQRGATAGERSIGSICGRACGHGRGEDHRIRVAPGASIGRERSASAGAVAAESLPAR